MPPHAAPIIRRYKSPDSVDIASPPASTTIPGIVVTSPAPESFASSSGLVSKLTMYCMANFALGFGAGLIVAHLIHRISKRRASKRQQEAQALKTSPSDTSTAAHMPSNDVEENQTITESVANYGATSTGSTPEGQTTSNEDRNVGPVKVTRLMIYPIKGCAPTNVTTAAVTATGLENDRLMMVVDFTGRDLNQKKYPALTLALPTMLPNGDVRLEAPDISPVEFTPQTRTPKKMVTAHGVSCEAVDQGDAAADFFSALLEIAGVRLVRIRDGFHRMSSDGTFETSFADVFPYLLTTEPSRCEVERLCGKPVIMERFRPNIVVDGAGLSPFAEDKWTEIRVGSCEFDVAKGCTRCKVILVDPSTGKVDEEGEPMSTLKKHRTFKNKVFFGQNLVAKGLKSGKKVMIAVGDEMKIASQ